MRGVARAVFLSLARDDRLPPRFCRGLEPGEAVGGSPRLDQKRANASPKPKSISWNSFHAEDWEGLTTKERIRRCSLASFRRE
jgi:hypothetical protein